MSTKVSIGVDKVEVEQLGKELPKAQVNLKLALKANGELNDKLKALKAYDLLFLLDKVFFGHSLYLKGDWSSRKESSTYYPWYRSVIGQLGSLPS